MTDWTNREASWKKHETEGKSSFKKTGLFGIIRSLHRKTSLSKPATTFSECPTVKMLEDYRREFELQKSKATAQISRLQTRLI